MHAYYICVYIYMVAHLEGGNIKEILCGIWVRCVNGKVLQQLRVRVDVALVSCRTKVRCGSSRHRRRRI